MTGEEIQKRREYIEERITFWNRKLVDLKDTCNHARVSGEYRASTGNWDPHDDVYWWSGNCLDCGEYLRAYSGDVGYKEYPKRVVKKG